MNWIIGCRLVLHLRNIDFDEKLAGQILKQYKLLFQIEKNKQKLETREY